MADVWGDPIKKIVKACGPSKDSAGAQKKGTFGPTKDMPQWDVLFDGETRPVWMFFATPPAEGEEVEIRLCTSTNREGKEFKNWHTVEMYQKMQSAPRGGGGGYGGAKPNYSLEQEAYRDGQAAAIKALQGGVLGKDGNPMPFTYANIKQLASFLAKDIVDAGKKSEA